ncbi:MAG: 16S rRNA (cytidine(1402)-2'-O)-methyltransferase [Kiloniellaceae bacterium]
MSPKSHPNQSSSARAEPIGTAPRSKPALGAKPGPGLYLVATPIGNLADVSLRALGLLAKADLIACEDTRVTRKLLTRHGIETPLLTYHEHNARRMRPKLIEQIKCGNAVALVCDAGTPLISDPGHKLVAAAIAEGLAVTALPGPSAALTALTLSGLPSERFLFAGFLPVKTSARRQALSDLAPVKASLVIFESPRRLAAALADMADVLGPRPAAVAREMTKLHEELRRGSLAELAAHYRETGPPKGEVVVVVGPPAENSGARAAEDLDAKLRAALESASLRDAAAAVAAATGLPTRQVYARALHLATGRRRSGAG